MRNMRVVELVEDVLVDVLDVHPETVLPYASLSDDLGATEADVVAILQRLERVLPADALRRLIPAQTAGPAGSFSVEDLVDLVEARAGCASGVPVAAAPRRSDENRAPHLRSRR
jgi:hypothetical protein